MRTRTLLILTVLWLIPFTAHAQEGTQAAITAPADGETVSGVAAITGSADDPTFVGYQLWFAPGGTEQWFAVTGPIQQPVQEGELAQWDTSQLPPGQYRLRLQVFRADGSVTEAVVENLQVIAVESADPAAGDQAASPVPPTDIPVLETLPTAPVESGPVVENVPIESSQPTVAGESSPDLGSAFCTGALIGAGLFALMGVYVAARSRLTSQGRSTTNR